MLQKDPKGKVYSKGNFSVVKLLSVPTMALNFSLRLGRCHFLFSFDTVWAVFFAGSVAVLLDGTFTFHQRNAMELP